MPSRREFPVSSPGPHPTIWFKSGDHEDTLYGEDVHACVVDEASRLKAGAWYAIRTTLTATRGRIRIIGNVKGKKNWFYQLARRAQSGHPEMGYHRLTAYDAIKAGVLHEAEVASARESGMPEHVWRELYMAEAADDEGNPFGVESIKAYIVLASSVASPRRWSAGSAPAGNVPAASAYARPSGPRPAARHHAATAMPRPYRPPSACARASHPPCCSSSDCSSSSLLLRSRVGWWGLAATHTARSPGIPRWDITG
jgi:hypothetical protein